MDPVTRDGSTTVDFDVLEADKNGRTPEHKKCDWENKSGFQIISKRKDIERILN